MCACVCECERANKCIKLLPRIFCTSTKLHIHHLHLLTTTDDFSFSIGVMTPAGRRLTSLLLVFHVLNFSVRFHSTAIKQIWTKRACYSEDDCKNKDMLVQRDNSLLPLTPCWHACINFLFHILEQRVAVCAIFIGLPLASKRT